MRVDELAERWMRAIPAVRAREIRVAYLRNEIASAHEDEVVRALDDVCAQAEQADERAREVIDALIPTLVDQKHALTDRLCAVARVRGYIAFSRLTRSQGLEHFADEGPAPDARKTLPVAGRALTLGERKMAARARDRDVLDRLLRDPHPAVILHLLSNPRIIEDDVVRLAARRPTFPDVQRVIARSARFGVRQRVRFALVNNPFTPPEIATPLLSLLNRHELDLVASTPELSRNVRAAAMDLLGRRPPLPPGEGGEGEPQ